MSELGFDTDWVNPSLPSAQNFNLPFQVMVVTGYGGTTFSRHATAEEAWEEASKQNDAAGSGTFYTACDEQFNPLTEGYFRKEEERFEEMTDGLRV